MDCLKSGVADGAASWRRRGRTGRVVWDRDGKATIEPLSNGGSWYDIVARLRLPAGSVPAWEIRGISASYELGAHRYTSLFRQSVRLPASHECA